MLNVLVKQFQLIALFAYFNAEQITYRQHSDPTLAIDDGKMSTADQLHAFERLVWSFVALNHGPQLARYISNFNRVRVASSHYDAVQDIALGKDAKQLAGIVDHTDGADVSCGHELGRFLHGCRGLRRVRLAVANHVPDQHRICLLLIWLWGAVL
jgi:hypothetical protein